MSRIHALSAVVCFVVITLFSGASSSRPENLVTKDTCNITKSCITLPDGCTNITCYYISWHELVENESIEIELRGPANMGPEFRIAIGFGLRNTMQEADVYICDQLGLMTATIRGQYEFVPDETFPTGGNTSFAYINGKTQCRFNRSLSVTKQIGEGKRHNFDLRTDSYYLLMAGGEFDAETGNYHEWAIVHRKKINFTENFKNQSANRSPIPSATTPSTNTQTQQSTQATSTRTENLVTKDTCNITKSCITLPDGCTNITCYYISWHESVENESIEIELRGPANMGPEFRIAIGFGLRNTMQEADVYICDQLGLMTATIRGQYEFVPDNTFPTGGSFAYINAKTQCRFNRSLSVTKQIGEGKRHNFDLRTDSYYLLMAGGAFDLETGDHHDWAIVYRKKINFTENFESERANRALMPITDTPESTTSFAGKLVFSACVLAWSVLLGGFAME